MKNGTIIEQGNHKQLIEKMVNMLNFTIANLHSKIKIESIILHFNCKY